jgi:hypothetical protein
MAAVTFAASARQALPSLAIGRRLQQRLRVDASVFHKRKPVILLLQLLEMRAACDTQWNAVSAATAPAVIRGEHSLVLRDVVSRQHGVHAIACTKYECIT